MAWRFLDSSGKLKQSAPSSSTYVSGELAYAEITTATISLASSGDATVVVTAPAYTFDGATVAVVEFFTPYWYAPIATNCYLYLYEDGAQRGLIAQAYAQSSNSYRPLLARIRFTPSAGSRTYSIRGNSGEVYSGTGAGSAHVPSSIRVSRA